MNISWKATVTLLILTLIGVSSSFLEGHPRRLETTAGKSKSSLSPFDLHILNNAAHMLEEGRRTFFALRRSAMRVLGWPAPTA